MKNIRPFSLMAVISMVIFIAGCWIPENFDAKVTVNKDGSYTFTYDGILTFVPALTAAKEGSFSKKDEVEFKKEAEEFRKEPGYKKVKYLGKGRFKVFVKIIGKPNEKYYFLNEEIKIFSVIPQKDGLLHITAERFSQKDLNELKSIGAKVNGNLTVSLEKGVRVLKHNAQSEPKLFGFFGGYKWEIKSVDADPIIIVQPSFVNSKNEDFANSKSHSKINVEHIKNDLLNKYISSWDCDINEYDQTLIKVLDSKFQKENAIVYIFLKVCRRESGHKGKFRLQYEYGAGDWNLVGIKTISSQKLSRKDIAFFKRLRELEQYPLHYAAAVGNIDGVKAAIANGVSVDKKEGKKGTHPLMFAAESGNAEVFRFLIRKGADVNATNNNGHRALTSAAVSGNFDCVEILLGEDADVNAKYNNGLTALMAAAFNGNQETTKLLIRKGADVNAKNIHGGTALMVAAGSGNADCAKVLIKKGADVNVKTNSGYTALMGSAEKWRADTLKLLINYGANVNAKTTKGEWTPLLLAAEKPLNENTVNMLIKPGGDFHSAWTNANQWRADTVKFLINSGADVNTKTAEKGWTPLHFAVRNVMDIDTIKALIDAGANVNAKTNDGQTAIKLARFKPEIRSLLEKEDGKKY